MKNTTFSNQVSHLELNILYAVPFVIVCLFLYFPNNYAMQHVMPVATSLYALIKCCALDIDEKDEVYRFSSVALTLFCMLTSIGFLVSHSDGVIEQPQMLLHFAMIFFDTSTPLVVLKFLERIARK